MRGDAMATGAVGIEVARVDAGMAALSEAVVVLVLMGFAPPLISTVRVYESSSGPACAHLTPRRSR
jgi:hypothetical protein